MSIRQLVSAVLLALSAAGNGFAQAYWSKVSTAGITDDICSVTYANGTFAAATAQGNVLTSGDGLTWAIQAVSPGTPLASIAYGNGAWVAVGAGGTILVSSDLKTWANDSSETTNSLNGVAFTSSGYPWVGGYFIAVGDSGTILTSFDAQTWTIQWSGVTSNLYGADSSGLLCGQAATILEPGFGFIGGIFDPGGPFPNASNFSQEDLHAALVYFVTYYGSAITNSQGTTYEAVGTNGTIIFWSFLGAMPLTGNVVFQRGIVPTGITATLRGLTIGNGTLVAVGNQGTILTSTDGETWTQRFPGDSPSTLSTASLLSAAFSPTLQRFVVVGTGGTILVSNATAIVLGNVSTRGNVSATQTLIGGFVVEGPSARSVLIRADGPVLSKFSVPSPLADPVLTVYDNNQNVVATNTGWTTNTNSALISAAATAVGAFALPNPSKDSAVLLTLQPGAYTAVITSAGENSGTALFEAYTY